MLHRKLLIMTALMLVILILLSGIHLSADPRDIAIAILISQNAQPYNETLEGFKQSLQREGIGAQFIEYRLQGNRAKASQSILEIGKSSIDLVLALGALAANISLDNILDAPVIAGLVLRKENLENSGNATGVVLEFPIETQFALLKKILPEATTIGVIYNPKENHEVVKAASKTARIMGLKVDAQEVHTPQEIPLALENLSKSTDVLWGIADTIVLDPQTAKHILLYSYRNFIPIIGLSNEWTEAGALYALDRDYRDIGMQCGEMALKILRGSRAGSIPPSYPRKALYSLNLKTAEHMGINTGDEIIKNADFVYERAVYANN